MRAIGAIPGGPRSGEPVLPSDRLTLEPGVALAPVFRPLQPFRLACGFGLLPLRGAFALAFAGRHLVDRRLPLRGPFALPGLALAGILAERRRRRLRDDDGALAPCRHISGEGGRRECESEQCRGDAEAVTHEQNPLLETIMGAGLGRQPAFDRKLQLLPSLRAVILFPIDPAREADVTSGVVCA